MRSLLANLKDPWKLLVTALALANLIAVVAVFLKFRERTAASEARAELQSWLDPKQKGSIYKEVKTLHEMLDFQRQSGLQSTESTQVSDFIASAAREANLAVQNIATQASPGRDKGITDYKFIVTFSADEKIGVDRAQLAFFLFIIKMKVPQLKIQSINTGAGRTEVERADKWRPQIVFVLSKEEAAGAST